MHLIFFPHSDPKSWRHRLVVNHITPLLTNFLLIRRKENSLLKKRCRSILEIPILCFLFLSLGLQIKIKDKGKDIKEIERRVRMILKNKMNEGDVCERARVYVTH